MSKTATRNHVIDALATYICVEAKRNSRFTYEVNMTTIGILLGATEGEIIKAHRRAREILRDFM